MACFEEQAVHDAAGRRLEGDEDHQPLGGAGKHCRAWDVYFLLRIPFVGWFSRAKEKNNNLRVPSFGFIYCGIIFVPV